MPRHTTSTCRPGRRDAVVLALLAMGALISAGVHVITHEIGWPSALAVLLLMVTASWATRVWTLLRRADAEAHALAEEEAGWWSGPMAAYGGGEEETVAFGRTVVSIATRRSQPDAGTQKAG